MVARGLGGLRQPAPHGGPGLTKDLPASEFDEPADAATSGVDARDSSGRAGRRSGTVAQGDRLKAYRPIPPDLRRAALEDGLSAYARGDFFQAHELLEPAWMGTSDLAERALYQGIIKIAAGYVHAVRGNPIGVARNLSGARAHLDTSRRLNQEVARGAGIDIGRLIGDIDDRLIAVAAIAGELAGACAPLIDLLPEAPRIR